MLNLIALLLVLLGQSADYATSCYSRRFPAAKEGNGLLTDSTGRFSPIKGTVKFALIIPYVFAYFQHWGDAGGTLFCAVISGGLAGFLPAILNIRAMRSIK